MYWPVIALATVYLALVAAPLQWVEWTTPRTKLLSGIPALCIYVWALLFSIETSTVLDTMLSGVWVAAVGLRASLVLGGLIPVFLGVAAAARSNGAPPGPFVGPFSAIVTVFADFLFVLFLVSPRE